MLFYIFLHIFAKNVFARFSQTSRIFANFAGFCTNVPYLPRKQGKVLILLEIIPNWLSNNAFYMFLHKFAKNVFARFLQTSRIFTNFANFCTNVAFLPRKQEKMLIVLEISHNSLLESAFYIFLHKFEKKNVFARFYKRREISQTFAYLLRNRGNILIVLQPLWIFANFTYFKIFVSH